MKFLSYIFEEDLKPKPIFWFIFFVLIFLYFMFCSVVLRELVIPKMYSAYVGGGHMPADPQYYHNLATENVQITKFAGLKNFKFQPAGQGIAGLASLAYLIYESPYMVVLLNAILHSISSILMVLILRRWFSLGTSVIASMPLIISPYMILWYSQINKESLVLFGCLLLIYGLISFINSIKLLNKKIIISLVFIFSGVLVTWSVRPYMNAFLIPIIFFTIVISIVFSFKNLSISFLFRKQYLIYLSLILVILFSLSLLSNNGASGDAINKLRNYQKNDASSSTISSLCFRQLDRDVWSPSTFLPHYLNDKIKVMMGHRCQIFSLLETHSDLTTQVSIFDTDQLPDSSVDALLYVPRAILWGVLSPWPQHWDRIFNPKFSIFYLIASFESFLLYIGLFSLCFWLYFNKKWSILVPISICMTIMSIYAFSTPFVGALYRYRYPWWILLICLVTATLIDLIIKKINIRS